MERKARQVLKELLAAGFREVRVHGDHHRFDDNRGHYVTISYTNLGDTIKKGTYNAILKQAGLK
ncbi:MAG: type II toxin-antitoxin system HicA family toxin [Lactobacillus sp.]|nr:type II toxin-antitoxin system HicA family toxin [Lactobacillus sp.]